MKIAALSAPVALFVIASATQAALVASDNGSNYGGGWTNGSNGGTGFGAWQIAVSGNGFAGNFIGNPSSAGISGMNAQSFGLYANPQGSGASVTATRAFGAALGVGDSFSMQWGINWDGDSGTSGIKGFRLQAGSSDVISVQNAGNSDITVNGSNIGFGYGTQAMTWTFTQVSSTTVLVTANDRDGSGTYSANITVSGYLSGFSLFASQLAGGDNRQPYFNDFAIDAVPAPGAIALLGVAGLVGSRRRR